jgi:hypothetical protein
MTRASARSIVRTGAVAAILALLAGSGLIADVPCARATVFAQDGWGWWWDNGDAAARSRGGTSVAVTGYGASGEVNPAAIALANVSYGFLSYAGEVTSVKGSGPDEGNGFRQRTDLLPHAGGVIVLPGGLRASAIFRAQSDATYERSQRFTESVTGPYTLRSEGSGGLSRFQIGLAAPALGNRLLWGLAAGRVQGILKESFTQDFESSDERDLRQYVDTRFRGAWVGSGGFVAIPTPRVALGLSGSVGGSSRVIQEMTVVQGANFYERQEGRQGLPSQWAAGVRVTPQPRLSLSADLVRTLWSEARLTPGPGVSSHPFHDTTRWGAGIEYVLGTPESPRWTLRGGLSGSDYHVRTADTGATVKEWAGALGIGKRLAKGRAALDLGLEYGNRGDRTKVGAEERFVRVNLGITFSSTLREY